MNKCDLKNDRKFLWICGGSASGKRTLLNRIKDREKEFICGKLHINGHVSFLDLSLGHVKSDILRANSNFNVIKWQRKGSHLMKEIKRKRPLNNHYAFFLSPPLEKHKSFFIKNVLIPGG